MTLNEHPPVEHLSDVLRVVALHGPLAGGLLECWFLEGIDEDEQRSAIYALVKAGHLVITNGSLDIRGADRTRWATMGEDEKHARAEAIESVVKCAIIAGRAATIMRTSPAEATKMLGTLALEGTRGMMAAKRADEAKKR